MATKPRRGAQPGDLGRPEEIVAAALKLFGEQGVHAVTTRQIAARVGISQPSLYAFFATKQALVAEVSRRAFAALSAAMAREAGKGPASSLLARLGRVYIDFGLRQPDAYRIAFMIEGMRREAGGGLDAALKAGLEAFAIFRGAMARTLGTGASGEDVDLAAQSAWASLHGLVSLIIARPNFPWAARRRLIETHLRRLFPGTK